MKTVLRKGAAALFVFALAGFLAGCSGSFVDPGWIEALGDTGGSGGSSNLYNTYWEYETEDEYIIAVFGTAKNRQRVIYAAINQPRRRGPVCR
jgi:hypothetical protein